ncbi:Hypothetical predicted protein, partial [Drosophila guanche]
MKNKPNLYELLVKMAKDRLRTDTVIKIGDCQFPVHFMVLRSYSQSFRDAGYELQLELPENQVTPRCFSLIYDWMLTDKPLLPRLGLLEVLRAAKFLKMTQLERQCENCLLDGCREDAAALLYVEARRLDMERSQRRFLQRISKFFLTLVASEEFLDLPLKALLLLLNSSMLGVNSELEVFMSA